MHIIASNTHVYVCVCARICVTYSYVFVIVLIWCIKLIYLVLKLRFFFVKLQSDFVFLREEYKYGNRFSISRQIFEAFLANKLSWQLNLSLSSSLRLVPLNLRWLDLKSYWEVTFEQEVPTYRLWSRSSVTSLV